MLDGLVSTLTLVYSEKVDAMAVHSGNVLHIEQLGFDRLF
jgi:hypothetical protein